MDFDILKDMHRSADSRIVLLVLDGLGGLEREPGGPTELEAARTPNLDDLAGRSVCGLHVPVGPGITPGSGPGHLGLFGYDPVEFQIGRGVLSALGGEFDLTPQDVAARGNFCTVDESGLVTDRRAGRISTETCRELCEILRRIELPNLQLFVEPEKEHRFLLVLRGDGLGGEVSDTDPQQAGLKPEHPQALEPSAERTAAAVHTFCEQAEKLLADKHPANMVLLRGFAKLPGWPSFKEAFGLNGAAVADYPMYRGVAKLLGMKALPCEPAMDQKLGVVQKHWKEHDFFFVHHKKTDSTGEDGDFDKKVAEIEYVDSAIPQLMALKPDVVIVTGDHSTPALMAQHSWHPVPVLLYSSRCRSDSVREFGERPCMAGGLGPRMSTADLVPLALANAMKLDKFGA